MSTLKIRLISCLFLCFSYGSLRLPLGHCQSETAKASKPIVRSITVEVRDIFDEDDVGGFYRLVNNLKASTKTEIVRRELLLQEGDVFDRFLLEESERKLRSLPFLRKISITPVRDGAFIDLLVQVQDTWTLFPFINLSSGGGTDKKAIGLTESNLFGYGKRLEFLVADDEGRQKVEAVWDDPRLFGTYQRLTVGHFQRSDGFRTIGAYGRPFRSLVEKSSWGFEADVFDLVGRLFEATDERFIFRQRRLSFGGGYSLAGGNPEKRRRRFSLGYRFSRDEFSEADRADFNDINLAFNPALSDPSNLAENRRFSGPFVSFQQIRQDFLSINFVDRFDRIQDFNLGNELNLGAQFAGKAFDSRQDELLLTASDSQGWRVTPTAFLRASLASSMRIDDVGAENMRLRTEVKFYNILGPKFYRGVFLGKHTLALNFAADYGEKLDRDFEYLLGARNGLRGYEDRSFSGDQRFVFNAEDRFHFVEDVFRLVSVGGALFFDAGGTGRNGFADILKDELYADVGFGFRFGLTRSSGGSVLRIDVAFPLRDGPDGSERFEPRLLLTSGQLFSSFLSTETSAKSTAQVSSGFLP